MEVLSIAGSVSGLLRSAAKVAEFISSMIDAPHLMRNVLDEVAALSAIFQQMEDLILNPLNGTHDRKSMIYVHQVITALTGCVCAFSELEQALDGLKTSNINVWDRGKWVAKESDFNRIIGALQNYKSSLNLMLTIFNCHSNRKAAKSMEELQSLLENVLRADPGLSSRMASLKQHQDESDNASVRTTSTTNTWRNWRAMMRPFEKTLSKTRVYSRANPADTASFKTLETSATNWSQISDLSLSQISSVAVILLPITISDVYNSTFHNFSICTAQRSVIPPSTFSSNMPPDDGLPDGHPVFGVVVPHRYGAPPEWERERLSPRPTGPPPGKCHCDFHTKFRSVPYYDHPVAQYSCQLCTEFGDVPGTLNLTINAICYNSPYSTGGIHCIRLSALVRIEREFTGDGVGFTIACSDCTFSFKIAGPNDAYDRLTEGMKSSYDLKKLEGADGYYVSGRVGRGYPGTGTQQGL